ncbi:adenosylcobinamide-phosphate synthase CbiB [Thermophagus sp. OGC60D27]|uniref:adenosylcobinamide-phosphate synthase CbiB n=1 Tax=Thermophagus sp. OGC60D27 TaxID=3458415 RepID=UPI0040383916
MGLKIHIGAIIIAYLLDRLLGDPPWLPHPVVWFGKIIGWCDHRLNSGTHRMLKGRGVALLAVMVVYLFFRGGWELFFSLSPMAGGLVETVFIFYGLAGTTLIKEGKAVFEKLESGIEAGRKQLSRIVGRDTAALSEREIKTATLETMAENLSDGVVAPLFWLAIAGMPGMMAYKMVNTLDSMIGYRNEKYEQFGKGAARLDDVANFIPARITAWLMALCGWSMRSCRFILRYGKAHSSPNAGYPEAALAGILNVQFGGDHTYFGRQMHKPIIGTNPREPEKSDLKKTISINRAVEVVMLALVISGIIISEILRV